MMDQETTSDNLNLEFPSQETSEQSEPQNQELSDFGAQFISNIPDEDREIVSRYVKDWDGNVTRKFQEYAEKQKVYDELGDVSTLRNAHQILTDLQRDPVSFFESYRDYLIENQDTISQLYGVENLAERIGIQMSMMENMGGDEQDFDDPSAAKIAELEAKLSEYSERFEQAEQSRTQQEQMRVLDSTLEKMHNEHGDFDETFVLSQIASGLTPEQAIEAFNNLKQSIINSHGESAPDLLSGPAGTPLDQVDMSKLANPADRKKFGAALLQRSLKN